MAQSPDETTYVEVPFIEQLKKMGWEHIEGDIDVPYLTERESFRDVLLVPRLRSALKKMNYVLIPFIRNRRFYEHTHRFRKNI